MATIKEIAGFAGVSTTTVSNVIHGKKSRVSPETFFAITSLLKKHHYVEKLGLRHLNNDKSQIICLIINPTRKYENTIFQDPFYGQILGMVEKLLHEKQYYLMVYVSIDINDIFRTIAAWNADGIIAVSFRAEDCDKLTLLTGKPVVSIDVMGTVTSRFINIGLEDFEGGYRMTRYLITSGYDPIWIFANEDTGVDHERWRGYQKAFDESTLPYTRERYVFFPRNRDQRFRYYKTLLPQWKQCRGKGALFFLSDFYAIECIGFLSEHKLTVPRDIAVAGFDDTTYSRMSVPPLTTIHQDIPQKAVHAVDQLLRLLNHEPILKQDIRLPVELIIRGSA
ncbi:MAG: LacI family transcriptional regulator [Treponema sp.]|jgi:LacI family transcriptional regulator|nr:LacI family transcriptional regulator [Treponema sp.]